MTDLLLSFLGLAILTVLVGVTGLCVGAFVNSGNSSLRELFLRDQLLGLLALVVGFALVKASGITIFLALLIPLIWARKYFQLPVFRLPESKRLYFDLLLTVFIVSGICAVPEFLWMYSSQYNQLLNVPHFDFLYYARVAYFLSETGSENGLMSINVLFPEYANTRMPYHYPEIWLNALIHKLTGKSAVKTEMLVVIPYLKGLMLTVINTAARKKFGGALRNWQVWIITIILAGITGVFFQAYLKSSWLQFHDGITLAGALMSFGRKYLFLSVYLAYAILILWLGKRYIPFIIVMMAVPIFSVGTMPGLIAVLTGVVVFLYYKNRIPRSILFGSLTGVLLMAFFYFIFYRIFASPDVQEHIQHTMLLSDLIKQPDLTNFKQLFFAAFFPAARMIVLYAPWLLIMLVAVHFKPDTILFIMLVLAIAGGNFAAALAKGIPDSGQLFYNSLPMINILIMAMILKGADFSYHRRVLNIALMLSGVSLLTYELYTDVNFYRKIIKPYNTVETKEKIKNLNAVEQLAQGKPVIGLFIVPPDEIADVPSFYETNYRNRHFYLQFIDQYRDAINVSSLNYLGYSKHISDKDLVSMKLTEISIFIEKEHLSMNTQAIEKFSEKSNAVFLAKGDSLYLKGQMSF